MTFSHRWTGPNAAVFDLSTRGEGRVLMTDGGIVGLGSMETDQYVRATPALAGQRYIGTHEKAREVFWPLVIDGEDGTWDTLQAAFWASLRPGKYGVWRVTNDDDNSYRELTCRYVPAALAYKVDPSIAGLELVPVDMVADDPWWKGAEVLRQFQTAEDPLPFFAVTTDRVLNLMSASTTATATIDNPGDADAWPVYTINGPATAFSITIDGGTFAGVIAVPPGQTLVIDTDPTVQVATLSTSPDPVTRQLSAVDWRPIPAGESVALALNLSGTGSIAVSFKPRYYRAW